MMTRISIAAIALLYSIEAYAGACPAGSRVSSELPVDALGSIWIDNPVGSIDVVGLDTRTSTVAVIVETTITATSQAALKEGMETVRVTLEGDNNVRLLRAVVP